ncbi:MAG: signal peptidase II [Clostridiales bacterium]|nr:signal peptidase II [Clostridiales bacterium]
MKKYALWILPGLAVLLADRAVKAAAAGAHRPLIPGVIGLNWTENSGMALGLLQGGTVGILILTAALILVCALLLRGVRLRGLAPVAVSMMAGGALGNLIDRVSLGYVQDMIELLFMRFYIFNVADAGVVLGAVLCGASLLFRPQDWSRKP